METRRLVGLGQNARRTSIAQWQMTAERTCARNQRTRSIKAQLNIKLVSLVVELKPAIVWRAAFSIQLVALSRQKGNPTDLRPRIYIALQTDQDGLKAQLCHRDYVEPITVANYPITVINIWLRVRPTVILKLKYYIGESQCTITVLSVTFQLEFFFVFILTVPVY